jgi:hypothetical protein
MLTAWVMANEDAKSRLSSDRLDVEIRFLTLSGSLISSLTSPNSSLSQEKSSSQSSPRPAPCLPSQRWSMRDDPDRRGSVYRFPQSRVLLCDAWCVEEGKQKTRRCKGQWKGKDAARAETHGSHGRAIGDAPPSSRGSCPGRASCFIPSICLDLLPGPSHYPI